MNSDGDKIYTKIIDLDEIVHNFFISNHLGMSTKMIPNEKKKFELQKLLSTIFFYIKSVRSPMFLTQFHFSFLHS